MKILKIKDNKGFFAVDGKTWLPIDQISKDHLLQLLDQTLNGSVEMDEFDNEKLGNQAHQIIYKNIYEKFVELGKNKSRFKDESELIYKDAIEKYRQ
jgi:hypothetical protein